MMLKVAALLAWIALAVSFYVWWSSGQPNWQALSGSLGISLLMLAMVVVGRQRRVAYSMLLAISVALALVSIAIGLSR